MSDYIPIDCNFYDELVLLAMHKTPITVIPNLYHVPEGDVVLDLKTMPSKEEFLILKSGIQIRLDKIASLENDVLFLSLDESMFEEE